MTQSEGTSARPSVFLHIGTMKSGTTYMQERLSANRGTLEAHGVNWAGDNWGQQVRAVNELLDWRPGRADPRAWDDLASSMVAHPGISLLSMEFLFVATPRQIARMARSLDGADVHVVVTLRDAVAAAPSQWQSAVRSGMKNGWARYARFMGLVGKGPSRATSLLFMTPARHFSLRHSVELVLEPWLQHIPTENFHAVLVPKSRQDPDLLWKRFAQAVGIPPEWAPDRPAFSRQSIGYASASLISRVNRRFRDTDEPAYRAVVRRLLCDDALTRRAGAESAIPLTRTVYLAGIRQNVRNRRALSASRVPVIGDLGDLPSVPDPELLSSLGNHVDAPVHEEILAAAEDALVALSRRSAALQASEPPSEPEPGELSREWRRSPDPSQAAARSVAAAVQKAVEAQRLTRGRKRRGSRPNPDDD